VIFPSRRTRKALVLVVSRKRSTVIRPSFHGTVSGSGAGAAASGTGRSAAGTVRAGNTVPHRDGTVVCTL